MADPKFKQSFHRQKIRRMGKDEFYSWLADISARHKEEIKSFYEDLENVVSRNYLALEQYIPVIEAYKSVN